MLGSDSAYFRGHPLMVPVEGVSPSELRDTYHEGRSGGRIHMATDILAMRGTPVLAAANGRIITVVSDAARVGEAGVAVYGAAKAGAAAFCRALAQEVGAAGITVNCVALGSIEDQEVDPGRDDRLSRRYAIRRRGTPNDVAGMVLFLASDLASWVTGQTYSVNGGYVMLP